MNRLEHERYGAVRWLIVLGLALACAACRKLPGPSECQRVAVVVLGITDAEMLQDARVKLRFDQLTTDCLLTPFDSELLRCIDESGRSRQCFLQFQQRLESAQEQERALPDPDFGTNVRRW